MRKIILSLVFILLLFDVAAAQFKLVAEGKAFKEPLTGLAKILQLKNGNTIFMHFTLNDGINLRVYNAVHEEVAVTNFNPASSQLDGEAVDGVFEVNGDVVLMLNTRSVWGSVLYQIIIDGKTGAVKEQTEVGQLIDRYAGVANGFYVRKDPLSDNYAVAIFNKREPNRNKRIEIITYGADNKKVSDAYYISASEKYLLLTLMDMSVIGPGKVCLSAYGYNISKGDDNDREFIFATIDKGARSFDFTELHLTDQTVQDAITRYNPVTKKLIMASVIMGKPIERSNEISYCLTMIDPFEKKLLNSGPLILPRRLTKSGFNGVPLNLFINDDGGYTVVYEELTAFYAPSQPVANTELNRTGIVNYNKEGVVTSDYLIRKSHTVFWAALDPFYQSLREETASDLFKDNQYKSFIYLSGKSTAFVLFNDVERNNKKQESGGITKMEKVGESDGFYYTLTGPGIVPKRDYIFGPPVNKKDHNAALLTVCDYDREKNLLVTLKFEKEGRDKGIKLVWLNP